MIEAEYPIRIEQYALVPDSGGVGKYRGGLSMVREYRLLADEAVLSVRSDKRRFPPFGLAGGQPGSPSMNIVNGRTVLPTLMMKPYPLKKGDVFRHQLAGGGGYGDPHERDVELVQRDALQGRITLAHAREAYGVVLNADFSVDTRATAGLRRRA